MVYPISGHWSWGGGWLAQLDDLTGFHDFAGSTAVHVVKIRTGESGIDALQGGKDKSLLEKDPSFGRIDIFQTRPNPYLQ